MMLKVKEKMWSLGLMIGISCALQADARETLDQMKKQIMIHMQGKVQSAEIIVHGMVTPDINKRFGQVVVDRLLKGKIILGSTLMVRWDGPGEIPELIWSNERSLQRGSKATWLLRWDETGKTFRPVDKDGYLADGVRHVDLKVEAIQNILTRKDLTEPMISEKLGGSSNTAVFNFVDQNAGAILDFSERRFRYVVGAPKAIRQVRLTVRSDGPIGIDEACEMLRGALLREGYQIKLDKKNRFLEVLRDE